jgi:hypothetical protein
MIIGGSLANMAGRDQTDAFLATLKQELHQERIFKLSPPPGRMMAAAIDWQIIGRAADLLTIAAALWAGYRRFVLPLLKEGKNDGPGLFLMLQNPGGRPAHILLRKKLNTQEEFTAEFIKTFDEASKTASPDAHPDPELWKEL